jgi:predicted O-methyltransferase YrrM
MMQNRSLADDIMNSIAPDCWNGKWSQVNGFGGGMAVELEIGEFLHGLVRATKPEVIIETGSHKGYSTVMIAQAMKENGLGRMWSVDIFDYGVAALCAKYGFANLVTFMQGNSPDMIKALAATIPSVDFLWLDADHSEEFIIAELSAAKPMLKSGTLIALHDSLSHPSEDLAVRRIKAMYPAWEHIRLISARGFDLLRIP